MARPQKNRGRTAYPTLEQYTCERRTFLRRLVFGAVSVGIGGRILSACTSRVNIDGETTLPDLHTVRLPGEGFASAYMDFDEYVRYAVTFTTYSEEFAVYYLAHEEEGLSVLTAVLSSRTCDDFSGSMSGVRRDLAAALEEHYLTLHGDPGELVHSLEIIVDSCEYTPIAGDMEPPGYP